MSITSPHPPILSSQLIIPYLIIIALDSTLNKLAVRPPISYQITDVIDHGQIFAPPQSYNHVFTGVQRNAGAVHADRGRFPPPLLHLR